LILGGSYEFLLPEGKPDQDKKRDALAKIFSYLDYDFGMLSPEESSYLSKSPSGIPDGWKYYSQITFKKFKIENGKTVGIITFPTIEDDKSNQISEALAARMVSCFKKFRKEADILIGMSPWGYFKEKSLLKNSQYMQCPLDILLGSGKGPGLTGQLVAENSTLWVRCYPTGKAVSRVDIIKFPDKNSDFKWKFGENIRCLIQSLLKNTREDPKVLNLLVGISDEK
jgi:hypothetical protein